MKKQNSDLKKTSHKTDTAAQGKAYDIPAVSCALTTIEFLCRAGRPVTQAEICEAAGMSVTTGYRMVKCLLRHNWITVTPKRTYTLATEALMPILRNHSLSRLMECAQPLLNALAQTTGLSAKLSVREGQEQVTVMRAESPAAFAVTGKVGTRFPIIEGTVGAALLADAGSAELQNLTAECPEEIAEKNTPATLKERIAAVREKGFTASTSGNRWRVEALSVPVRNTAGTVVAAVTLVGINGDINAENMVTLARAAQATARSVEESF